MSDNTIKTNTRLPVITAEKRIDGECSGDYILPDTVADIKRVLRVTPKLIPGAWYRDGKTICFEGRAIYNALIVTEENKPVKLTYEEPYSDSIDIEYTTENPQISIRPEPGALSWRIVNQRKLGIKLKICTHVTVTEKQETKPDTDSLNPTELQKDEVTLPSVCVYTAAESGRLCEDIELEGTLPQIGEIIDCRCELAVNECKCGEGSVQCRGEAMVSILYLSDTGEPVFTVRHLPFMQPVALDNAASDSQALAYAWCGAPDYEIKPNGYGESRILALDLDYTVCAECAASEPITLLRDVYSTERAVTTVPTVLTLTGLERAYTTNFTVNASALRSEIGANDAERAIDADVRVVISDCRRDRERMKLILEGSADITVITAHKAEDGMTDYMSHSFSTPVKCELESNGTDNPDSFRYRCVSSVTMVRPRLDTTGLYCDFEVALALFAMSRETVTAVGSAHPDETADTDPRDGASMILCCPTADETLWDIAKHYRTTMTAISEDNSFTEPECHSQYRVKSKHNILLIPDSPKIAMPAVGA